MTSTCEMVCEAGSIWHLTRCLFMWWWKKTKSIKTIKIIKKRFPFNTKRRKKSVFREDLQTESKSTCLMWKGSSFHLLGAATEKTRFPPQPHLWVWNDQQELICWSEGAWRGEQIGQRLWDETMKTFKKLTRMWYALKDISWHSEWSKDWNSFNSY